MSYKKLEYIEATGTQYIDLGFTLNENHMIDIKFAVSGTSAIFGSRNHANSNNIAICHTVGQGMVIDFNNGSCETYRLIKPITEGEVYRVVSGKNCRSIYNIDGSSLSNNTNFCGHTITTPGNAYLFNMSYSPNGWSQMTGRIYYCKIYHKNILVYDIIPVLDENETVCMYDKISRNYFRNRGTGSFNAGKEVIEENDSEFMPVMTNVDAYFDARIGVTDSSWKNRTGDIDFQLFNPIETDNGVEVVGSETSYGKFTKPWTSGSSRTNYYVFKNTSGSFANWKTIIGNEVENYKCSTIAMDSSGYIKFTRPDIIPSTSYGFRCSDWHVVAWISDGSKQTTSMWIDGVYVGYVYNMLGWADDTYLARGSSWHYTNNNTAFRAIAIADSAHSDADVVTNSNWLYQTYIANYDPNLYAMKYLVKSDNTLYAIVDNTLTELENEVLTSELFKTYGVDKIPEWSIISELINPELLYWTSDSTYIPSTAKVTAIPKPQHIVTDDIDLSHPTIVGIANVTIEYEGTPIFACEFDGVWKAYNGTAWVNTETGMTADAFMAITSEQWNGMISDLDLFKIRFTLDSVDDKVNRLVVNYNVDPSQAV